MGKWRMCKYVQRVISAVILTMLGMAGCVPSPPLSTPTQMHTEETPVPRTPTLTPSDTPTPARAASDVTPETPSPSFTPTLAPTVEPSPHPESNLRITVIYDNYPYDARLQTDWGFAAYIEYGDKTVLFDTGGNGRILLDNVDKLGLDLQAIDAIVLSHIHGDHTGGLQALFDAGITPPVYVPASFPASFKNNVLGHTTLAEVQGAIEIFPGIHTTGQLGGAIVEQGLVLETSEGLVLVTGCAHPGIVSMVRQAKQVIDEKVALVLGGFHLREAGPRRIESIIQDFRDLDVQRLAATHCTGDAAIAAFAEAYGDDYISAGVGRVFAFGEVETPGVSGSSPRADPFELISLDRMFADMEALTAIQPYSGWRNSGTEGEAEALDYVASRLADMRVLNRLGMDVERQHFNVFMATELWETRLFVTVNSEEVEVPADGLRGPRDDIAQALHFDADGVLNDDTRNPVEVASDPVLLRTIEAGMDFQARVRGNIVFLDYALIDRALLGTERAVKAVDTVLAAQPAGLVLLTQFSNAQGESHGFAVGDNSALNWAKIPPSMPVLYARLEDLAPAGLQSWEDVSRIEAARMIWDADVFQPGKSGNLIAHIPGQDSTHALILGAHIDSPNNPGAMDDGSGCVILLEIAQVLDMAQRQPPVDLWLVWFGSEELGLYGASHFVLTHQDLLDRTLAMLQIDDLTHPLDGIEASLDLVTWSYASFGDRRMTWPAYLRQRAEARGLKTFSRDYPFPYSDNTTFNGFDVPNADLIYENAEVMEASGSFHHAAHIHDPYDTVALAREVGDVLEEMAHIVLTAALDTGQDQPDLRVAPAPDRRVVFVASHTESIHMAPTSLTDIGMALAWQSFDVDALPYAQEVRAEDLEDADMVVVLPSHDYPSPEGEVAQYDTVWNVGELDVLEDYVSSGGLLVLTNSAYRLRFSRPYDVNEDWSDLNALAMRFGITYQEGTLEAGTSRKREDHPLVQGMTTLQSFAGNGVPFTMENGQVLAQAGGVVTVGLVPHGEGEVLALSDVGFLGANWNGMDNLPFWNNLADYARSR